MDKFLSLLILWLQLNFDSKQDVSQSPEALSVREGDSVDLNCSYPDSALYFLQWFRQDPGKGLTSLLSIQANQKKQTSGRITVSLDKPSGHSASHMVTSQHSDSTTDLCAIIYLRFYYFLIFACGAKISLSILLWSPCPSPTPGVYSNSCPSNEMSIVFIHIFAYCILYSFLLIQESFLLERWGMLMKTVNFSVVLYLASGGHCCLNWKLVFCKRSEEPYGLKRYSDHFLHSEM
ncbi:hypothetical protein FD755_024137 [Muntiacus reevesi]|uniref:Immunoglobulin V-set domain-containing protein n=1 Tax=Muntiacus reevesi TaxID=9886 RepID=A0A5N3VVB6_MUNRE|nr:hypothetical protein FD755_024137 [Muntiacus reevesi]